MHRSNIMFSYFKKSEKNLLHEVCLLVRCLMLNWSRRRAFIYATKTWNLWVFFYIFSKVFAEKYIKNILQEMKNGLSLRQQQLQVIMYNIITWAFHTLTCRQKKCTPKNEPYFYSSLTLKDTEIFPKLLFWSDSWVTATMFHNRFLIINLFLMTVVMRSKQRMDITP